MTTEAHLEKSHGWSYAMVRAIWSTKGGQHSDRARARLLELHGLEHDRITPKVPHTHEVGFPIGPSGGYNLRKGTR